MKPTTITKRKTFRIISYGGIGDAILLTPSLMTIKSQFPQSRLIVYWSTEPHRDVFMHNPHIDCLKKLSALAAPLDSLLFYAKPSLFTFPDYGRLMPGKFYNKNAIRIMAEMIGIDIPESRPAVFLTEKEEREAKDLLSGIKTPIVIHGTTAYCWNKEWPWENWETLVRSMPGYSFFQLGAKNDRPIAGAVNMLGKPLRESMALIKHSISFVGIDSGLAHAANAFGKPGVVLFGPSTPIVWGHDTNINVFRKLPCSPCIDTLLMEPCPYGAPCMQISVDEVRNALLKQVSNIY